MVGTDVSFKATVVVCLEDFKNSGISIAVTVACLGKISVFKMLYVSNMCKCDSIAMLTDYLCNVVFGVCI